MFQSSKPVWQINRRISATILRIRNKYRIIKTAWPEYHDSHKNPPTMEYVLIGLARIQITTDQSIVDQLECLAFNICISSVICFNVNSMAELTAQIIDICNTLIKIEQSHNNLLIEMQLTNVIY